MKRIYVLLILLFFLFLCTIQAQQPWRFHIAFEDGSGQRDTIWMVFDNSATVEGVDFQLGEGTPEYDPSAFNVFLYNMNVDSTKVKAYPYWIFPNMSTDEVFAINYTYPVIIRWDSSMFHAPFLPISPLMNYAIVLGDYQFRVLGPDPTSPYPHNVYMFSKDSLYCPKDSIGANPIPLFGFGCLGFRLGYDAYLSIEKQNELKLLLFPNPTTGLIQMNCSKPIISYELYDVQGILVFKELFNTPRSLNEYKIPFQIFNPGIYILKAINSSHQIGLEKLIVVKPTN